MFNTSLKQLLASAVVAVSLCVAPAFVFAEAPAEAASTEQSALTRVSINSADAATLAKFLVGIGPAKAEAIVAWRTANGRFTDAEQLLQVKGIGKATLDKNKARITL